MRISNIYTKLLKEMLLEWAEQYPNDDEIFIRYNVEDSLCISQESNNSTAEAIADQVSHVLDKMLKGTHWLDNINEGEYNGDLDSEIIFEGSLKSCKFTIKKRDYVIKIKEGRTKRII